MAAATAQSPICLRNFGREHRAGGFLDQLLMPALNGTVPLAEMDDIAVLVGQDLDLDMPGPIAIFLDIDVGITEPGLGLGAGGGKGIGQRRRRMNDLHPPSAAAGSGLDDDRIADFRCDALTLFRRLHPFLGPGEDRHADGRNRLPGADLVPHQTHVLRSGADKGHAAVAADFRKFGIFGEKAVAGMDGIGIGDFGGTDDRLHVQIAFGARRRTDADALIGQLHMQCLTVGIRMHRHRFDAQFLAGADDPQGDFAAIGDQDFMKHAEYETPGKSSFVKIGHLSSALGHLIQSHAMANDAAQRLQPFHQEQRIAEFHRLRIFLENLDYLAFELGLDLVHQLHGLDNAENLSLFHDGPPGRRDRNPGRAPGRRCRRWAR